MSLFANWDDMRVFILSYITMPCGCGFLGYIIMPGFTPWLYTISHFEHHTYMNKKWILPTGLLVGLANGLFGAGGGTVLVPALEKFKPLETHKAHASALAVILPLSVVSAVVYVWGVDVDWPAVAFVSMGGVVGGVVGAKLLKKISAGWLNMLFGLFLAAGAIRMLFS